MPRDVFPQPTTRTIVQDLADRLGLHAREFNRMDDHPGKGDESEEEGKGRESLKALCYGNIVADQIRLLTQFPKNAVDAVMMLAVAHNHIDEDRDNGVMTDLGVQAIERATAFLMEHLGVTGTDFSEYIFADYMRDRALGRDVKLHAPNLVAA
ncbi:hypothetical protein E9232_004874 [Inquilinus ginsengisoli]|uniref:Uncharacterized protein n=1 Tax=Inquilinus ginsengisoli TaxID=363840 RepID=A0ABU1JWE6_9PROT|nr:hypothetical protein [Inquilinus ginsengisoli]MDR6292334.1 hypothetical protein [Inquilinus ginsengisoli]